MKDLTKDSIVAHLFCMAAPVAVSMIAQIAYQLVDLYFVTRISVAATAGVTAAGTVILIVGALTQALGVGAAALVAHAAGRKDQADALMIFNQALLLALLFAAVTTILMYLLAGRYMRALAADTATIAAGIAFLQWVIPGYALLFPMAIVSAALRGTGVVHGPIFIYVITLLLNALLAPILIAGFGTGVALGVQGAGLATTLSVAAGNVLLGVYLRREVYLSVRPELLRRVRPAEWRRILVIGAPTGAELVLMFLSTAILYYAIRPFGAEVQAGFGIGSRVLQVILLPGLAIAVAAGPIAGQNFGARNGPRVRETFLKAMLIASAIMAALTVLAQLYPELLVRLFAVDGSVVDTAASFLRWMSWTFVAQALIGVCATMFQGMGNTVPPLICSAARLLVLVSAVVWLSGDRGMRIEQVWLLLIATVLLHATLCLTLLNLELRRKLERP